MSTIAVIVPTQWIDPEGNLHPEDGVKRGFAEEHGRKELARFASSNGVTLTGPVTVQAYEDARIGGTAFGPPPGHDVADLEPVAWLRLESDTVPA